MLASMLLTLIGIILVGLLLTVLAIRGKRLNTHPTCRGCNFDLNDIYPASPTCPECGAGLKRDRAVRMGQRARRPILLALGLVLTLTPLVPIGIAAFAALTGTDLNTHKPLAMLIWEAGVADKGASSVIAAELNRRMVAGLDPDDQQRIISLAIDRQSDESRPWDQAWGQVIDQARLSGTLARPDLQRFLNGAAIPKLTARRRVAQGGNLPVLINAEIRVGPTWQSMVYLYCEKVELGGRRIRRESAKGLDYFVESVAMEDRLIRTIWASSSTAIGTNFNTSLVNLQIPPDMPPGLVDLVFEVSVTGRLSSIQTSSLDLPPNQSDDDARRWTLSVPVEVVTASEGSVALISPDPKTTAQLEKCLRPVTAGSSNLTMSGSSINLNFWIKDLPVPVSYEVHLRTPEGTKRLGTFSSGESSDPNFRDFYAGNPSNRAISRYIRDLQPGTIDLILKPAPKHAARSLDLTSIYGGELVFKDLELVDPRQQKKPTLNTTK